MDNTNIPWIEKYRPFTCNDFISQDIVKITLMEYINKGGIPNMIFYGPPGTGKTSLIGICAHILYDEYYDIMVLDLNASDERGVETVRTKIKRFTSVNMMKTNNNVKYKLVILDEVDSMTYDAQIVLTQIIDENMENIRFCLICNYIKKIIPTLISRCVIFNFFPLCLNDIKCRLKHIIEKENMNITNKGLNNIIEKSNGDMRSAINILHSLHMSHKNKITLQTVNMHRGVPDEKIMKMISNIMKKNEFSIAYEKIKRLKTKHCILVTDIINHIYKTLLNQYLNVQKEDINESNKIKKMLVNLKTLEKYNNISDNIQIGNLICIYK